MEQGRRYFWGMVCAAMAVLLACAAPTMASRSGCLAKGTKAGPRAESSQAIVIRKRNGTYWGCKFNNTRMRMLEGQTDGTTVLAKRIQVKRLHALYATKYSGLGKTIKVYSFKISTGAFDTSGGDTTFRDRDGVDRHHGDDVTLGKNMILRNNGSIAWAFTFRSEDDKWNRILAIDSNGAHEIDADESGDALDREHPIDPDSLDLFEDSGASATITWRREAGPAGGAPIRRQEQLR